MNAKLIFNFSDNRLNLNCSTTLQEFKDYVDSLNFEDALEVKKMVNTEFKRYNSMFPKKEKIAPPPRDMVTISRAEYDELRSLIPIVKEQAKRIELLEIEVKKLREENQELRQQNQELKEVCDKYFNKYGALDFSEEKNNDYQR